MQHVPKVLMVLSLLALVGTWGATSGNAADRYITRRGDTLWEIAGRYAQQDDTMTIYQMMAALFDANPEAFMNNDMNLLKSGYALHIPTREELGAPHAPSERGEQRGVAALSEPPASATEEADTTPIIVAKDVAKLQNELALTQEQAIRQHAENEALRARVSALEARVITLDKRASAQEATGRDGKAVTRPHTPSRIAAWLSAPNMMVLISGLVVLGLAVLWFWRWRMMANTVASMTHQSRAEQAATEATDPLALGLGDLAVETELAGAAQDVTAAATDVSLEIEAAADAARAHLMIGLDDLELEPAQAGGETPGLPSTASTSPKADPSPPSNVC